MRTGPDGHICRGSVTFDARHKAVARPSPGSRLARQRSIVLHGRPRPRSRWAGTDERHRLHRTQTLAVPIQPDGVVEPPQSAPPRSRLEARCLPMPLSCCATTTRRCAPCSARSLPGAQQMPAKAPLQKIIELLTVHTYIENEVMYPQVRKLLSDLEEDVLESYEEHHVADVLVTELDTLKPGDDRFEAKTMALIESVTAPCTRRSRTGSPRCGKAWDASSSRTVLSPRGRAQGSPRCTPRRAARASASHRPLWATPPPPSLLVCTRCRRRRPGRSRRDHGRVQCQSALAIPAAAEPPQSREPPFGGR